jgi:hypothetical protein
LPEYFREKVHKIGNKIILSHSTLETDIFGLKCVESEIILFSKAVFIYLLYQESAFTSKK